MKRDNYYNYIDEQLHILAHRIISNGKLNILHLHLHSENFYLHFFNLLYGYNLINLNDVSQNIEAIDLIDHDKKIMIQVSSTSTKQKIESALSKNILKEYAGYRFKFISIAKDASDLRKKEYKNPHAVTFNPSEDIYDIHSLLNTILSLDLDKLKEVYNFIQKELGEESKNRFDSTILKEKYLNNFKTISLLANDKKPIDDIFINLTIIKEEEKKKDNPKLINREPILNSYEEIHKPKEPIAIEELINISKKSLIYGKAGIGKTTLCKYIAYKWAKEELYQEFEYVIYIALREWKTKGLKGAIKDNYYSQDEEKITLDIKANNSKMLFLFDGYDELEGDKKKILRDEIEHYNLNHYIITTRPYGYQKSDFRVDEYFETIGFTDKDVEKYIDAFFRENNDKAKSLKAYLETNINIKHIGYIPLMLEMICSQWEQKEFSESLTMTELYSQVVEDILNRYSAQKDDKRVYKRKNRKKIKEQLGKLAFRGLTKQTILFDGDFIENSVDDIFFEENVIYSGFLKSDAKEKDLLDNRFEFLHLTFQEYFSALYVSTLSQEEQSEIIRDWKFYPHMQMFFAFLGGLIGDKEFLLREIESEPKDLFGFYEFYILSFCISQIKVSQLHKNRIDNINLQVLKWMKTSSDYIFIMLKNLIHIIDEKQMCNQLLPILKVYDGFSEIKKENIANLFILLNKKDDKYVNILIEILENTHPSNMGFITKALLRVPKSNDKIVDKLISIIKENDITSYQIKNIFNLLLELNRTDNKILDLLLLFIKNEKFSTNLDYYLNFLKKMNRNDGYFVDRIIELINCNEVSIYTRTDIAKIFSYLKIDDKKKVNKLIEFIMNNKIKSDIDIFKKIFFWEKDENKIISIINIFLEDNSFYDTKILFSLLRKSDKFNEYEMAILKNKNEWNLRRLIELISFFDISTEINEINEINEDIEIEEEVFIKDYVSRLELVEDIEDKKGIGYFIFSILMEIDKDFYEFTAELLIEYLRDNDKGFFPFTISISNLFVYYLSQKESFFETILKYIKDENILNSFGLSIIPELIEQESHNDKFLMIVMDFLKRKDIDHVLDNCKICESLKKIKREDNEYIDILFNSIHSYEVEDYYDEAVRTTIVEILVDISSKNFYAFEKLYFYNLNKYCSFIYRNILENIKISTLFKAYDKEFHKRNHQSIDFRIDNIFSYIADYTVDKFQPLYLKNNKLHTIENGKEISTQREVDEATLNEIKMMLRGEGLNG